MKPRQQGSRVVQAGALTGGGHFQRIKQQRKRQLRRLNSAHLQARSSEVRLSFQVRELSALTPRG